MPRFKLTIEYDGSGFVGWQRQDNGPSVQAALEVAMSRFCGHGVTVVGAGRTDAGVHALGQVAHVDLERPWPPATIRAATNFHLKPAAVAVLAAEEVAAPFHARFSATARAYRYRLCNRPAPPVLDRGRVWWVPIPLDVRAMAAAARLLVGRHDFSAFRSSLCQAPSPLKTLDRLEVVARDRGEIWIEARARSFLHNQVRIITGSLKRIGEGRWRPADLEAALASRERARAGPTAPAHGLYLIAVDYQPRGAAAKEPAGSATDSPPASPAHSPAHSIEAVGGPADEEAEDKVDSDHGRRR